MKNEKVLNITKKSICTGIGLLADIISELNFILMVFEKVKLRTFHLDLKNGTEVCVCVM